MADAAVARIAELELPLGLFPGRFGGWADRVRPKAFNPSVPVRAPATAKTRRAFSVGMPSFDVKGWMILDGTVGQEGPRPWLESEFKVQGLETQTPVHLQVHRNPHLRLLV